MEAEVFRGSFTLFSMNCKETTVFLEWHLFTEDVVRVRIIPLSCLHIWTYSPLVKLVKPVLKTYSDPFQPLQFHFWYLCGSSAPKSCSFFQNHKDFLTTSRLKCFLIGHIPGGLWVARDNLRIRCYRCVLLEKLSVMSHVGFKRGNWHFNMKVNGDGLTDPDPGGQ